MQSIDERVSRRRVATRPIAMARLGALLTAPLLLAGLCSPSSGLASVTIGSNLADTPDATFNCSGTHQCTVTHSSLQSPLQASGGITSSMNGAVIRWRVRTTGSPGTLTLRILKPNGSGQ